MANYGNIPPVGQPGSAPYPTAPMQQVPPAYPTAGAAYPSQPGAPPPYAPAPMAAQPPMYGQPGLAYPTQQAYPTQPQGYPVTQPQGYPPMPQPNVTVVHQGGFDAGARFDVTGPTLPPPPPGIVPTASQVAASQGQNVVVTQQRGDFVTGGSDGGMVIW